MGKFKRIYICSECGHKEIKWQGRCPECGAWNSFVEEVVEESSNKSQKIRQITDFSTPPKRLSEIKTLKITKEPTTIDELDKVLDGGIVPGQIILIAGVPGIGKSTLMLEIASVYAKRDKEVLYVSGEESINQIATRAERLNIKENRITILCETDIEKIIETINKINPAVLIIDSIQTIYTSDIPSSPATPLQIKYATSEIVKISKTKEIITFILAHVTKEGDIAGPKILEHMVDTVLYFETDMKTPYRVLRSFKNRFGSVDEIGIFEINEKGISSASTYNQEDLNTSLAGKTFSCLIEGTRAFITRVEALVVRSFFPYPKRVFSSIDSNYAQILLASIEKNTTLKFDTFDVYINIPTPFKTKDRASDLAVCAAVISSLKNIKIPPDTAFMGEVGMLGQIYSVSYLQKRINELEKNGFKNIVLPYTKDKINSSIKTIFLSHISELEAFLNNPITEKNP